MMIIYEEFLEKFKDYSDAKWCVGGMSGGSCWGSDPEPISSYDVEDEPEDDQLEELLEVIKPELTFLQWRKLIRAGIYTYSDKTEGEYYGNYSDYKIRALNKKILYEALLGME